jgi:hypothetical protein
MIVESKFPPGTPVRVREVTRMRDDDFVTETVGVVVSWGDKPTGSWYAHGKNDKLWLRRLTLRKADGELTTVVVDDQTYVAKLEAAKS